MFLEPGIYVRHHLFRYSFLDIYSLEKAREARAEHGVHGVCVVEADKRGIDPLGLKVTQKSGGDRTHSLNISALSTPQRKTMKNVEQRPLAVVHREQQDSAQSQDTYPAPYRVLNIRWPLIVRGTSRSI